MTAIYYSAFPAFFDELREKLTQQPACCELRNTVAQYVKDKGLEELDADTRKDLLSEASQEGSESRRFIELEVIKFLHHNKVCIIWRFVSERACNCRIVCKHPPFTPFLSHTATPPEALLPSKP